MVAAVDALGIGIYTPEQAAFYARVQTKLLNRWLFGDGNGRSVVDAEVGAVEGDKTVTFLDLVQALAIRAIRNDYNIPLQKIRAAVDEARAVWKVKYPFAMHHQTCLFSDGTRSGHGEILIRRPNEPIESARLVQLSGRNAGNIVFKEVVELYLDELTFGTDGMATEWTPMRSRGHFISLSPKHRFGEPRVMPTGYTAETLYEAAVTEGGIDHAARAFGVEPEAVKLACKYIDHLHNNAA